MHYICLIEIYNNFFSLDVQRQWLCSNLVHEYIQTDLSDDLTTRGTVLFLFVRDHLQPIGYYCDNTYSQSLFKNLFVIRESCMCSVVVLIIMSRDYFYRRPAWLAVLHPVSLLLEQPPVMCTSLKQPL